MDHRSRTLSTWSSLLGLVSVVACAACGSSSVPAETDAGGHDASKPADAAKPVDASKDATPFSACGHPGDKGNSLGVGQYCTGTGCPATAPICSSIENVDGGTENTFFCVQPCTPCSPAGFCGSGASCVCKAAGECGCTPDSCTAIIPDAGAGVCEGGTTDGGSDGGAGTDSGDSGA
jgi:hypothetical protein